MTPVKGHGLPLLPGGGRPLLWKRSELKKADVGGFFDDESL
jgi:hypothetical protein